MNRALGHLCAHIGWTGPGEPPEDGEMIEMTLSSRHRIRNSIPGGLRPSTLPLGHGGSPQYWLSHVDGEETFFVSFKPPRPGTEHRTLACRAAVLTTILGPPPIKVEGSLKTVMSSSYQLLEWYEQPQYTVTLQVFWSTLDNVAVRVVRIVLGANKIYFWIFKITRYAVSFRLSAIWKNTALGNKK